MSQTYKLNHIEGEEIKHIYIFTSDQSVIEGEYVDSNGNPIFTADEMKKNKIEYYSIGGPDSN